MPSKKQINNCIPSSDAMLIFNIVKFACIKFPRSLSVVLIKVYRPFFLSTLNYRSYPTTQTKDLLIKMCLSAKCQLRCIQKGLETFNSLRTTVRLVKTNEVSISKPIRDFVGMVVYFLRGVNLNLQTIDSDWLPKYKCRVINQSEMLLGVKTTKVSIKTYLSANDSEGKVQRPFKITMLNLQGFSVMSKPNNCL